ncbi:MAG TPA: hypothetical protein VIY86_12115, partial [Pirellulaceae bacterium]
MAWVVLIGTSRSAEPVRAFLDALRQEGLYDLALVYTVHLQEDATIPEEIKAGLPWERARLAVAAADSESNLDHRLLQLIAAEVALQ